MSFVRAAVCSRSTLRTAPTARLFRGYSTEAAPKKSSNTPFYFLGAGVAGLAAYAYLELTGKEVVPLQEKSPLDPENFKDFTLKRVIPYNHNSSEFVFELPNNEASLLPVASCLVVKSSDPEGLVGKNGKPIIRPYTPISPSDKKGELVLLVKKYEQGNASKYIHDMKVGETLSIKGPIVKFPYQHNEFEQVALIGGGSGITPLFQIIEHALANPKNKTKFTLIYSNVTEQDILMKREFEDLKRKHPNTLDLVYALDKPSEGWSGLTGYVNKEAVEKYVAPASLGEKVKVFVCGPPGQVASLAGKKDGMKQGELGGILKELGYTSDQVFKF